jgi:membrane protease YdiL (CAAX protease family)
MMQWYWRLLWRSAAKHAATRRNTSEEWRTRAAISYRRSMDNARRARRGLLVFFAVLIPLSALVEALILRRTFKLPRGTLVLALMWVPALASVVARLATREGFGDLSFRVSGRPGARAVLIAVAFPLLVGAIAYGVAWSAGLAAFKAPDENPALILPLWMVPLSGPPAARLLQAIGLHLTIGAVSGCVFAAGEEIGWRGYLVQRLLEARVPWAIPLSGVIWAMWHWPLALGMKSPNVLLTLSLFTLVLIPIGALMAHLCLESRSVLPAILLHALWNELIGLVFGPFTVNEGIWLGESGILVVAVSTLLSLPFILRRPAAPPAHEGA